jgi:hypothetical protein
MAYAKMALIGQGVEIAPLSLPHMPNWHNFSACRFGRPIRKSSQPPFLFL